jgi:hypothetical protein
MGLLELIRRIFIVIRLRIMMMRLRKYTTRIAGEQVERGDLLVLGEDGKVYRAKGIRSKQCQTE